MFNSLKISFDVIPGGSEVKASACNLGAPGLIPGLGLSPGEGNSNPLQYSCLENPMEGGDWWATIHGVEKSRTQLSYFTFHFFTFDVWAIFIVFIEFVTILLLFDVLGFWPQGIWDLGSLTRDGTCIHCIGRGSLNHWTTREVLI